MTDLISRNNKGLYDAYSLGHVSIDWLAVLIRQIEKEVKSMRQELTEQGCDDSQFYDLDRLIAITSFTADEQLEHFDSIKTRFKEALEQAKESLLKHANVEKGNENKKAVSL